MSNEHNPGAVIERIVSEVLEHHLPRLKQEIAARVSSEMGGGNSPVVSSAIDLRKSIAGVHAASNQRDILRALLDASARYCGRAVLFLVKSGQVSGWQARGFDEDVKDFVLDPQSGLPARVLETRAPLSGNASEIDSRFLKRFGKPAEGHCILLPLLIKDKVAALLYADAGTEPGGALEAPALELLLMTTGTWLEVALVRRAATKDSESTGEVPVMKAAAAASAAGPAFADPFATHAPAFAHPKPAVEEPHAPLHSRDTEAALGGLTPEDADAHRKAMRFARLLVDEIKLYNQAKVREGREKRDLYDRLKEDIDKSRATYQKRYGNSAAAAGDYFNQEVIRSLAEDDVSLLGGNFKR